MGAPELLSTVIALLLLSAIQALPDVSNARADGLLTPPVLKPAPGDKGAPLALSLLTVGPLLAIHTSPSPSNARRPGPWIPAPLNGLSEARTPALLSSVTLEVMLLVSQGSS